MTYDFAVVRRALTFISSRRFSFLVGGRLKPDAARRFSTAQALQLAFCDWMTHVESLGDGSVQDRVLEYADDEFWTEYAYALDHAPRGAWPSVTITFAGGQRYVLLEGQPRWYDIYEGSFLDELPKRPVTLLTCDLTALWAETIDRLEKLGGVRAEPEHHPEREPGQGDGQGVGRPG